MIVPVRIRKATLGDVVTIVEFNTQLAHETEGLLLDNALVRHGVEDVLADPQKGSYWLAEVNGMIVGQLLVTSEWSDWRDGFFWWIQSLFVKKEWRSRGIFQALFEFLHEQAAEHPEVCGVRLYVEAQNSRAKRVYQMIGMERTRYEVYEMDFRKTPPPAPGELRGDARISVRA
jgi:ribosomal protein S18 acetylase RimI-like enzyme